MYSTFTKWLKMKFFQKTDENVADCLEKENCGRVLHLILDGEATDEEEKFFTNHIETCIQCFNDYELEKAIKQLIKNKVRKESVPNDLLASINYKIKGSTL